MEDKSASLSQDESFSDSGSAWGKDNRWSKSCRHVVYQFFRWRNRGHLGYNRTRGTFHVGSACVVGRQSGERFFPCGKILGRSQAALRAKLDHVNSLQEPKAALGRNKYDLVL
jgi:hypothetical protein